MTNDVKPAAETTRNGHFTQRYGALGRKGKPNDAYICLGDLCRIAGSLIACFLFLLHPALSNAVECATGRFLFDIQPGANQPSDISIGPDGDLYLVDGVNNRILVTGRSGERKFSFGKVGREPGEFLRPVGIDVSADGTVFVADTGNHRIQALI